MHSTHNEGKHVVAERFIGTLKNKIYKYKTSVAKNVYYDVLNDIVDECNNTYHSTIKMKPVDVEDDSFAEYNKKSDKKDPKFIVDDHVRISKYKNIFVKGYTPNWSEEIFVVKRIKNTVPWTYVISDLNGEGIVGSFYEKELQETDEKKIELQNYLKENEINYMSNGKDIIILLIAGLIKKIL